MSDETKRKGSAGKCPICGKAVDADYRPFCSARCQKVDLSRWLSEVYTVPGDDLPANADEPDESPGKDEQSH